MTTFLNAHQRQAVIALSGQAIRDFLGHASPSDFSGEAQQAVREFRANPTGYSDSQMLALGADVQKATDYPVRIEVRAPQSDGSAAQVAAKGIWGPARQAAAASIEQECRKLNLGVQVKLTGGSSLEFNIQGVDKALPIYYVQAHFEELLQQMNYCPGPRIDSRKTGTIIASDGDDTIYGRPAIGLLPRLADSPAWGPLKDYLKAGGVFMLISGNDLDRSFQRMVKDLPAEAYCRLLLAANGGAELVAVDSKGKAMAVDHYRRQALSKAKPGRALDMVYVGDDGAKCGNDYTAFAAVGFDRSVLVAPQFLSDYDPALKPGHIGGGLQGAAQFLQNFLAERGG